MISVEKLRVNRGLSRADLAKEAKVAVETVRLIEVDGRRPTPSTGKKIADVFGVQYTDLWPIVDDAEVPA